MSWFRITFIASCFLILLSFKLYEQPSVQGILPTFSESLVCNDNCQGGENGKVNETINRDDCVLLYYDDFDLGWGLWNDGGADSYLVNGFGAKNSKSLRIRDNSGSSSSAYTETINLSAYSEIKLAFSYLVFGMSNGEVFHVEISDNGGDSWEILDTWVCGFDFKINQRKEVMKVFQREFSTATRLRFRSDASSNADRIFLDGISISGCDEFLSKKTTEDFSWSAYMEQISPSAISSKGTVEFNFKNDFSIFPNPTFDKVYLNFDLVNEDVEFKSAIYDPSGNLIKSDFVKFEKFKNRSRKLELDVADFAEGIYYVKISMNDHVSIKKLMIAR